MDNLKVMLAAIVVLLLPSVACAGDTGEQVVIGRVVDVIARNIVEIESLTVQDADDQIWEFTTTDYVGVSAGHLRQHQVLGEKNTGDLQKDRRTAQRFRCSRRCGCAWKRSLRNPLEYF